MLTTDDSLEAHARMTMTLERPRVLPASRYRRRSDLLERQLADGFVVYDPRSERVHVLNEPARFVWARCDEHSTAAEIVAAVVETTGTPTALAAEDVFGALSDMLSENLLETI